MHWSTTVPRITADELRGITTINLDKTLEKAVASEVTATLTAGDQVGIGAYVAPGSEIDRQTGYDQLDRLTDGLDNDLHAGTNAQLLGYPKELRKLSSAMISTEAETTLRSDLAGER